MSRIRVLVADDHAVLRSGMKLLINSQPDMQVIGEAGNHDEALRRSRELKPDVLTLDLTMPGISGAKVIESLSHETPTITRVVVLTMHDDPAYFRVAMAAGASGYVVKQSADSELLDAIRSVAKGKTYTQVKLSDSAGPPPLMAGSPKEPTNLIRTLSEREREVLTMVAQGHTNQAVADRLVLSVKTVESYRARLMTKLGLRNRAELTQLAMEAGLLASSGGQE